jgi:hypothetical protein
MGARYYKSEVSILQRLYPTATKSEILTAIPGRNWGALRAYARRMNLHRSQKAISIAIKMGHIKAKRESEEEKNKIADIN